MNEREKILGRIREALRARAPHPGAHGHGAPSTPAGAGVLISIQAARPWLPPGGDTFDGQLERFRASSAELKTDFHLVNSREETHEVLISLRDTESWKRIGSHRGELASAACAALKLPVLSTDAPYDTRELERCDAGITECDALIAQTGSVLISNRSAGGRALSVLPPHHVVLARRDQMVPDLAAALEGVKRKYGPDYPSMISFVTGPSRTGDIERILVLGAHGPRKLTVICF